MVNDRPITIRIFFSVQTSVKVLKEDERIVISCGGKRDKLWRVNRWKREKIEWKLREMLRI